MTTLHRQRVKAKSALKVEALAIRHGIQRATELDRNNYRYPSAFTRVYKFSTFPTYCFRQGNQAVDFLACTDCDPTQFCLSLDLGWSFVRLKPRVLTNKKKEVNYVMHFSGANREYELPTSAHQGLSLQLLTDTTLLCLSFLPHSYVVTNDIDSHYILQLVPLSIFDQVRTKQLLICVHQLSFIQICHNKFGEYHQLN